METMIQDLRYSARMLLKKPGFTAIAVITLALGIGANTAIFSIVNSILLRPLPYKEPDRLAQVWETSEADAVTSRTASPNNFLDWRNQAKSFEGMSAIHLWLFTLTGTAEPTEVPGMKVSPGFFDVLGVSPQIGRAFSPDEDKPDRGQVVVISHGFWQRRFGGNADIIGKTVRLDDGTYEVIGVLRPDFRQTALVSDYNAEVWTPLMLDPAANRRSDHYLRVIARLKPGKKLEQAQSEMTAIASNLQQAYPNTNTDRSVLLVPLHEQVTGDIRWVLLMLQCATGFVLLIACTNVANLLLARMARREKEMAIRSALGAGRWQIVRLLVSEGIVLASIGGAIGLLLASWGTDLLVAIAPRDIPRLDEISLDSGVLLFTLAVTMLTVLFFALAPALQSSRINLNKALKEGGRSATPGHGLRGVLVVSEIALTLVLLVGSGLLLRSLILLQNIDPGFNPERLLTMRVSLLDSKYDDRRQVADYYKQLVSRIEALPGVQGATIVSNPPLVQPNMFWVSFEIEGQPVEPGREPTAQYHLISPGYFRTMEIPLIEGREFTERDSGDGTMVAIINDQFARLHFPGVNPIGRKIITGRTVREIVGIAANLKHRSLDADDLAELYVPHAQNPRGTLVVAIRTSIDPNRTIAAAQRAVWEGDPDAAVSLVATMDQILYDVVSRPRFNALLLGIFSLVALILASVGIYSVMSYTVTQSTREIGIRVALGAQQTDVLKLVLGQGLVMTLIGVGLGVVGAFGLTRLLESLLFGVTATDLTTFAGVAALLTVIALAACYFPARRAMKVDPMVALRYE